MTFIEFIGFIIAMAAFFFLIMKQAREERRRRSEHPDLYKEEIEDQQAQIREILDSLNIRAEEEMPVQERKEAPTPPPPPQKVVAEEPIERRTLLPISPFKDAAKERVFVDPYADRKKALEIPFDTDVYEERERQRIRVREILKGTDALKHAFILKEILGPPKGRP